MSTAERIYADVARRIRSGEWSPGFRIPYEQELADAYGCARATANKALSRLAAEGLIDRRRRAGSFVAPPVIRSAILSVPDIGALIESKGKSYRWRIIDAPAPWRGEEPALGEGEWLHLSGIHEADGQPFGHEARWIATSTVPAARSADLTACAPGAWLLQNVPWTEARHRVRAVRPDRSIAGELAIAPDTPCLQLERWTWRSGLPVTYVRLTFPGDRYDLEEAFAPPGAHS